nr:hypothetical protein Iba_chr15cCG2860 [Ipomoea batatas]
MGESQPLHDGTDGSELATWLTLNLLFAYPSLHRACRVFEGVKIKRHLPHKAAG